MKIAFLGASKTGKTVYFTALYHRFGSGAYMDRLPPTQENDYLEKGVKQRLSKVTMNIIGDDDLRERLTHQAKEFTKCPITDWPDATAQLAKANLELAMEFESLDPASDSNNGHSLDTTKTFTFFDPPGEAFTGVAEHSHVLREISNCGAAIVMLDAEVIVEGFKNGQVNQETGQLDFDSRAHIGTLLGLGNIEDVLGKMHKLVALDTVFPVCFVITKWDKVGQEELDWINRFVYDEVMVGLSRRNERFLICGCPIHVVDRETGGFRGKNLEWPFLFAIGGSLLQNCVRVAKEAVQYNTWSRSSEDKSNRLKDLYDNNPVVYALNYVFTWGENFEQEASMARYYSGVSDKKRSLSKEDFGLAGAIWGVIAAEQDQRGVRILKAGKEIDPRSEVA